MRGALREKRNNEREAGGAGGILDAVEDAVDALLEMDFADALIELPGLELGAALPEEPVLDPERGEMPGWRGGTEAPAWGSAPGALK